MASIPEGCTELLTEAGAKLRLVWSFLGVGDAARLARTEDASDEEVLLIEWERGRIWS